MGKDFIKDIKLKFKVDTSTLNAIEKEFNDTLSVIDKSASEDFKKYQAAVKELAKYQQALEDISTFEGEQWDEQRKRLEQQIELLKDYKNVVLEDEDAAGDGKSFGKSLFGSLFGGADSDKEDYAEFFADQIKNVASWFIGKLKDTFTNAWNELKEMVDYSQLSSSKTRSLALGYGFSSSEAYGYDKAMSMLGLSSMEDLMYANPQEREQFYEAFTKYSQKYTELEESGFFESMQETMFEFEEFKQDMQMEVIQFIADNKDTIMSAMKIGIKAGEYLIFALGKILDSFSSEGRSSSSRASATSDIIRNYKSQSTTNVTVDNTFNNVAKGDQTWLANAGQMVYTNVIKALKTIG